MSNVSDERLAALIKIVDGGSEYIRDSVDLDIQRALTELQALRKQSRPSVLTFGLGNPSAKEVLDYVNTGVLPSQREKP